MDPPEHWSPAMEHTTPREEREGESLDERLAEEEPDLAPPPEPRDEIDRMDADGELSGHPTDQDGEVTFARDDQGPADDGAESVARSLREP